MQGQALIVGMIGEDGSAGVPASAPRLGGWAYTATGQPYIHDLVASAVPAGSAFLGGGAYHPDGRRYVTSQAVSGGDAWLGGLRHRQDGAMRIDTATWELTDAFIGGWAVASGGAMRLSVTIPAGFVLDETAGLPILIEADTLGTDFIYQE